MNRYFPTFRSNKDTNSLRNDRSSSINGRPDTSSIRSRSVYEKEIERLQNIISEQVKDLQKMTNKANRFDMISASNERYKEYYEEAENEKTSWQRKLLELQRENNHLKQNIEYLQSNIKDYKEKNLELLKNVGGRDDVLHDVMEKNIILSSEIEKLKKKADEDNDKSREHELLKLNSKVKQLTITNEQLKKTIEGNTNKAKDNSSVIDELRKENENLKYHRQTKRQSTPSESSVTRNGSVYQTKEIDLDNSEEVSRLKITIQKLLERIDRRNSSIKDLNEKLSDSSRDVINLTTSFKQEQQLREYHENDFETQLSSLQESLIKLQKENEKLRHTVSEQEFDVANLKAETENLQIEKNIFEMKSNNLEQENHSINEKLNHFQRENKHLKNQINDKIDLNNSLLGKQEEFKTRSQRLESELSIQNDKSRQSMEENIILKSKIDEISSIYKTKVDDLESKLREERQYNSIETDASRNKIDINNSLLNQQKEFKTHIQRLESEISIQNNIAHQTMEENKILENKIDELSKNYKTKIDDLESKLREERQYNSTETYDSRDFRKPSSNGSSDYIESPYLNSTPYPSINDNRLTFSSIGKGERFSYLNIEQENFNLKSKIEKLQRLLDNRSQELSDITQERNQLADTIEHQKKMVIVEKKDDMCNGTFNDFSKLEDLLNTNEQIKKINEKIKMEKKELVDKIERDQMMIKDLEKHINSIEFEIKSHKQKYEKSHIDAKQLFEKNKELQDKNSNLLKTMDDHDREKSQLNDIIMNHKRELEYLENQLSKNQSIIDNNNHNMMNKDEKIRALQTEIGELKTTMENLVKENGNLKEANGKLERKVKRLKERKSNQNPNAPVYFESLSEEEEMDLRDRIVNCNKIIDAKNEEIAKKQNALEVIKEKFRSYKQEVNQNEFNKLNHENMLYSKKVHDFEIEVEKLKAQNKELSDESAMIRRDNINFQREMENMKKLNFNRTPGSIVPREERAVRSMILPNIADDIVLQNVPDWWRIHMIYKP